LVGFDVAELVGDDPSLAIVLPRSLETHIPRELSARKLRMQCALHNIKKFAFWKPESLPAFALWAIRYTHAQKKAAVPRSEITAL
jgi:hypothetical protein